MSEHERVRSNRLRPVKVEPDAVRPREKKVNVSKATKLTEEQKLVAIMAAIIRTQTGKDSEGVAVELARNILQLVRK